MSIVEKNQKVSISYTLRNKQGELIEQAPENNPLTYLHGYQYIVPGLETYLDGKQEGTAFEVTIPCNNAYGPRDDDLIISVARNDLDGLGELKVGLEIEMYQEDDEEDSSEDSDDHFWVPKTPDDLFGDTIKHKKEPEEPSFFIIKEIQKEHVILDGNHFLAGEDLYFTGTILNVETASFEEIEKNFLDSDPDTDGLF